MNALEELLTDAMADTSDDLTSTHADWDRVTTAVAARRRRRAATYRVGVALLIAVLGLGVFSARFGLTVDTIADPTQSSDSVSEASELGSWPDAQDVAAAAGERPQSQFWLAWLIGAGLPLLAALTAWLRAPRHLQTPVTSQRSARIVLASSVALAATIAVGAVVCAVLLFTYDPLAAQSGTSYLLSVLAITKLSFIGTVMVLSLSVITSNSDPDEGLVRRALYGVFGLLVTQWVASAFVGTVSQFFDWRTTEGVAGPVRGLWRLFFQGDAVYRDEFGSISALSSTLSTLAGLVGATLFLWAAKTFAQRVLAGEKLGSAVDRSPTTEVGSQSRAVRAAVALLLVLAAALPAYVYVQKDVVAQSLAHIVTLPPEIVEDGDFRVERDFDRGVFEQLDLVEITFVVPSTRTPLTEITDQQFLLERSGFDNRGREVVVRNRGAGFSNEFWSVERDEERGAITVSVRRESAVPGMNTALFIASLLILAATSTWIPKVVSKADVESDAIPGRRMGAWFVIAASAAIGVHLLAGLIGLEADVGDRASRGGATLFEIYTIQAEPRPQSLDDLSPWFVFLNVFTFIPVFGLATLGVRRLTRSRRITQAMIVAAVLSAVVTALLWGQLIWDWINWVFD